MRLSQLFRIINKKYIVRHFSLWNNMPSSNCSYLKNFANIDHLTGYKIIKKLHIEADDDAEISEMLVDTDHTDVELVKDALFKHSKDDVIQKLNNCASIEEALTVFHMQTVPYSIEHIAQTILVLVDIQTMFFHYSRPSQQARDKFINDLLANKEFTVFLKHVEDNVHTFPTNILSYVLYYLNKLGLKTDSSLIQSLAVELRDHLKLKLDVSHCAKLFKVIFAENSIRPYYISLPLIPSVINLIGRCQSVSELGHLTTCLNKLHNIVTRETLSRYKEEVHLFLREKRLNTKDSTLLKIIMFLNYPQWRNQNIVLISQCILTLKEDINSFRVNELLMIYEAAILRNDLDHQIIENMLVKFKQMDYMSSKILENICYIYLATDSLVPEAVNKCTEYIVNNHQNVIGFNAEKILYLCYYLAYYPINADKFLGVVIDTIIRDQERLSGLVFLQSALALCFFNKLPSSFIKQIFTVEFMDKLDAELASCYSRETYPQRVRNCLMQLNRAVCLEYPEYNVPWFHKKYVDEIERKYMIPESEIQFPLRIKDYLTEVAGNAGGVEDNVITPYGYHIDFVVSLDRNDQVVNSRSEDVNRRIAILLLRPYCYTRFYSHPKGKYQHKKRHLEMLGYEVSMVKFTEWINLLYAEERLEFLSDLIWPKKVENCTGNSRATKR
ncbi:unnamed protein product [Acanthoscelides obtectus]|uniref:RAP domain-containing protein n=1 Tax=Acanthoscelides obtectus TaxID=200917 RepID=A0A9P0KJD9_ACAOB|nr:unnamed protein product [Acanthoscelides obtectus]CAK1654694.1 FAST kinase domain-containing protein 1, mitochondrial [Acanthoscelides obtectus]